MTWMPPRLFSSREFTLPTVERTSAYFGWMISTNLYVNAAMSGTGTIATSASCQLLLTRMAAMATTITDSRNAEFIPSFRNRSSRFTSFDRMDIISPVCLSEKKFMFSRCILSYVSVRTECWMFCANEFQPQLRAQWNAAPRANAAAMMPTENQNCPAFVAGAISIARSRDSNGTCDASASTYGTLSSLEKNASTATPRMTTGSRFSTRAKMLAMTPVANANLLLDPYSRNSRFIALSAFSRCSSNGSSSSNSSITVGLARPS